MKGAQSGELDGEDNNDRSREIIKRTIEFIKAHS